MTTRLYLDTRNAKEESSAEYPIKVSINHKGSSSYINTGVKVSEKCWDKKTQKVIIHPDRQKLNVILAGKKYEIDIALENLRLEGKLHGLSATQIRNTLLEYLNTGPEQTEVTVRVCFEKYASLCDKERTRRGYLYTLKRIDDFTDSNKLTFRDITTGWLSEFDAFLARTAPSANARGILLRNIRTVFNYAVEEKLTFAEYPFKRFKIKTEPTKDRSYSVDELRQLFSYQCDKAREQYRDIFELSFLLCGINLADLLSLKEIRGGRIDFIRIKTGQPVSMKVYPEAMRIIEKYRGQEYLLNIKEKCGNYQNYLNRVNKNLKRIGMTYDPHKKTWTGQPLFPDLSYYCARYSWATLAAELDIPEKTVGAALGHSTATSVTSIYTRVDMRKKVDRANRMVIDEVFGKRN